MSNLSITAWLVSRRNWHLSNLFWIALWTPAWVLCYRTRHFMPLGIIWFGCLLTAVGEKTLKRILAENSANSQCHLAAVRPMRYIVVTYLAFVCYYIALSSRL